MQKGEIINNRYKVIRAIGNGGMANVYLADDLILKRKVCIKMLKLDLANNASTQIRFKREAQALTHLNSPYIIRVYDYGEIHHVQYLVKEYVKGMDLKQYIEKNHPLTVRDALNIIEQVVLAMEDVHDHNIVHRDIKPQNILISNHHIAKVTDFGIANILYESSIDQNHQVLGSVKYLSPEQITNNRASIQSDIYSLGIVFFELLAGYPPFSGNSVAEVTNQHLNKHLPSIHLIRKDVPKSLESIILRATAKNPNNRYQNDVELLTDLSKVDSHNEALKLTLKRFNNLKNKKENLTRTFENDDTKVLDLKTLKHYHKPINNPPKRYSKVNQYFLWLFIFIGFLGLCFITLIMIKNDSTIVPNVKGKDKYEAIRLLHKHHLSVGNIEFKDNDKLPFNDVVGISPSTHTKIKTNSKVVLILSNGSGTFVVKNYIGQNYQNIIQELKLLGFNVNVTYRASNEFKRGLILEQNLPVGMDINPKKKNIHFVISTGSHNYKLPNLNCMNKLEVLQYAKKYNLHIIFKYQSSKQPYNMVINQNPLPGMLEHDGDNIIITLSSYNK